MVLLNAPDSFDLTPVFLSYANFGFFNDEAALRKLVYVGGC